MRDWLKTEPVVIVRGRGAELHDANGRHFLDANSSIWTNLHGHNNPKLNRAIQRQLRKIAHSSALGLANEPASLLAEALVRAANPPELVVTTQSASPGKLRRTGKNARLDKIFFSDDGSTAMEVALKLSFEYARRSGLASKPRFLGLEGAYHGDTVGAVSLGHIDLFHKAYAPLLFKSDKVMAPYCYRCRFNRAQPERTDARDYRKCNWECLTDLEKKLTTARRASKPYTTFSVEPLMQGAAGMIAQPPTWLRSACDLARGNGALIVADEVMTGFGRTGLKAAPDQQQELKNPILQTRTARSGGLNHREIAGNSLFACHHEGVQPDFLALAKGLTGGYLPMAATLTSEAVFDAFLGEYHEFKTFFHGHSFTGNQLGAAAGLASMNLLDERGSQDQRRHLQATLQQSLKQLWEHPNVGDIRQVGLVAGVELVRDWRTREPFDLKDRAGIRVCEAMSRRGVLTRPIGNVIALLPPYCTTEKQAGKMVEVLRLSIAEAFPIPRRRQVGQD
jgi:adenosylmethionine---8-amino-7-oxononanoate aminotransferase